MRLLAVSDSDSYLKWSAALVTQALRLAEGSRGASSGDASPELEVDQVVLANVIAPSDEQVTAAVGEPGRSAEAVTTMSAIPLLARIRRTKPEVLLLACTGPALAAMVELLHLGGVLNSPDRPVLVSGLPGISFPANETAIALRAGMDLMVLHSHREVAAYREQWHHTGRTIAPGLEFVLARLPYLPENPADQVASPPNPELGQANPGQTFDAARPDVVFAAQSLVPAGREDRLRVLRALAAVPEQLIPVVKVRARGGERQAHNENYAYPDLARGHTRGPNPEEGLARVEFRAGSMQQALARAHGFATVSSTAVLEAITARVPSLVLEDFGVGAAQINLVFEGSGLFGTLDGLTAGNFHHPDPSWMEQNYFHGDQDNDWYARLADLVRRRREGGLAPVRVSPSGRPLSRLRRQLRVQPPMWVWNAAKSVRSNRSTG